MDIASRIVLALALAGFAAAQGTRVLGVITQVSPEGAVVKSDAGESTTVGFAPETVFRRVPPGEKDLTKAAAIKAADLTAGDRVLARGTVSGSLLIAQQVIAMSRADIARKQERDRAEWTRRGVAGLVTAVDTKKGEIAIRIPALMGEAQVLTVVAGKDAAFRRYAPDSVRFSDAKASTLADIRPGDQLRALGDRADGVPLFTAEEIVTGSFRTVAGTVISSTADSLELKDAQTGKTLTVRVTADSSLKRFPAMGGPGGPPNGVAAQGAGMPAIPPAGIRQGTPGGPGGANMRRPDFSQMLDRLPATTLADVKPGETIVVSSTRGASADTLTAITLLAGAERILAMQQQQAAASNARGGTGGGWNLDSMSMMSMP